jgi:Arc/MetJ-type ribon-helix-helix transcriptional regulator
MKERASFTFDSDTIKDIDELIVSGKYRNKSHIVEEAIKLLYNQEKKEKEEKLKNEQ